MRRIMGGLVVMFVAVYVIVNFTGTFQTDTYTVDNWELEGETTGGLETTEDLIYVEPDTNEEGTWTSDIIQAGQHYPLSTEILADSRDGTITFNLNMWNGTEGNLSEEPDKVVSREVLTGENTFEYERNGTYDYFEYEIIIDKTNNNNLQRPSVENLTVNLGSEEVDFQDFENMLIGFTLLLLMWGFYAILS